jgi:hypothetical protein
MRSSALAALIVATATAAGAAELVERVVAIVDGRVLCLSDVHAVMRLDGGSGGMALTRLVDETLLFHEAFRLPQSALSAQEEASLLAEAPDTSMRRVLHRRAVIRKYVAFRFRPQVRIDEEDVRRAYAEEVDRGGAAPFDEAAPLIRERLISQEVDRRVADWVRDLRAASAIRYNPPVPD